MERSVEQQPEIGSFGHALKMATKSPPQSAKAMGWSRSEIENTIVHYFYMKEVIDSSMARMSLVSATAGAERVAK